MRGRAPEICVEPTGTAWTFEMLADIGSLVLDSTSEALLSTV